MRCTQGTKWGGCCSGGVSYKGVSRRHAIYVFIHHQGSRVLKGRAIFQVTDQIHTARKREDEEDGRGETRVGERLPRQAAGGDTGIWAARWRIPDLTCVPARGGVLCKRKRKRVRGLCLRSRLFAHRLWLMSLKGQKPLRKINGISSARGNGL